ncbi:hypothetical protein ACX93W_21095 [Paenibacillus sp. CAU 1782]
MNEWTGPQQTGAQKGTSEASGISREGDVPEALGMLRAEEAISGADGQHAPRERRYPKRQLIGAKRWSARERDQLQALLQDGELYNFTEAEQAIQTFKNRRVD